MHVNRLDLAHSWHLKPSFHLCGMHPRLMEGTVCGELALPWVRTSPGAKECDQAWLNQTAFGWAPRPHLTLIIHSFEL